MTLLTSSNLLVTVPVIMGSQRAALKKVFERMPGSIRELAKAAGLSHVALIRARDGDLHLGRDRIEDLAGVLRRWGKTYGQLAELLEAAGTTDQERDDGET